MGEMGDGRRKGGRWESGLVLSLMRILINPAEAALRPPRFIRPEKPDCQQRRGRREGWDHRRGRGEKFSPTDEAKECWRGGRERQKKSVTERRRGGDRWEDGQRR